jgi:hypothetical protein
MGVEVKIHMVLTSAVDGDEWSTLCSCCLCPKLKFQPDILVRDGNGGQGR